MKKMTAIALTLTLFVGALTGCGSGTLQQQSAAGSVQESGSWTVATDGSTSMEKVIGRLEREAEKKKVEFHLTGGRAEITGVRRILDEMLYNLCDNAVKYNKENGTVDVIINQMEGGVNVIVRDTGIGIGPAHQDRVFERFYRVDKSHSKKVGGTGLGLAIVKHGAICHHAKISMDSTENKGTTMTISFPGSRFV